MNIVPLTAENILTGVVALLLACAAVWGLRCWTRRECRPRWWR
jgi:hypothetical protein